MVYQGLLYHPEKSQICELSMIAPQFTHSNLYCCNEVYCTMARQNDCDWKFG